MKLRFNGASTMRKSSCPVCGGRKTSNGVTFSKSFILPSGKVQTFRTGKEYEVSDRDGEFLLNYKFTEKDGRVRPSFERVNG